MANGMDIKSKEDWAELYKVNPDLALGLMFENISEIKSNCACRYDKCRLELRSSRVKNAILQAVSGFSGGVAAVATYIKFFFPDK